MSMKIARLDIGREKRTSIPEVVLAQGKAPEDVVGIAKHLLKATGRAIITRVEENHLKLLKKQFKKFYYNKRARVFVVKKEKEIDPIGVIGILCAGTSDISIAEEARVIAQELGANVLTGYDLGVAGIHRLFPVLEQMKDKADIFIVAAGMEGTLPGIVASLTEKPVIGVPTSSGYGLGEKGIGALTTMLQSCSPGLTVVNIDNGFGAAVAAVKILKSKIRGR